MPRDIFHLIDRKLSLLLDPKINAIGREFFTAIQSFRPDEFHKVPSIFAEYSSSVSKSINDIFTDSEDATLLVLSTTGAELTDSLIEKVVELLKNKIKSDIFTKKFDVLCESTERHFRSFGMKVQMDTLRLDLKRSAVVATAENQSRRNIAAFENDLHILASSTSKPVKGEKMEKTTNVETNTWKEIENDYGVSKKLLGKKINFVTDAFKRKVIFRDIEHAYYLANAGYSKPAVILAGGVTEELLRQYLIHNKVTPSDKTFDSYIKACEANCLLKKAVHRLSDSFRHFRNFVHLSNEITSKHTISKATAKGAVASIFTLANDF